MASAHFSWDELLRSATAERFPRLHQQQMNPSDEVRENLVYLAETVLEPLRAIVGVPIRVTSGYRSPGVNSRVGGSSRSQHLLGQAADLQIRRVPANAPRVPVDRVNANWFLWDAICRNLGEFDVDQVIHEYGDAWGKPAWIHVSASRDRNKRQMLKVGHYTGKRFVVLDLAQALDPGG